MNIRSTGSFVALLFLAACASRPASIWDSYVEKEGVEVTESKDAKGQDTREILLPEGIKVEQTYTDEGGLKTTASDTSEGGPVLCSWELNLTIRSELEACGGEGYGEVKEVLDDTIKRYNAFIVANSPSPMTQEEIEDHVQKRMAYEGDCITPLFDWGGMTEVQKKQLIRTIRHETDKVLAVQRPPVNNPCP